jgi:hypothetical protein
MQCLIVYAMLSITSYLLHYSYTPKFYKFWAINVNISKAGCSITLCIKFDSNIYSKSNTIFKLCVNKKNHKLCQDTAWVISITGNANSPAKTKETLARPQPTRKKFDNWEWSEITKWRIWQKMHRMIILIDITPTKCKRHRTHKTMDLKYRTHKPTSVTGMELTKWQVLQTYNAQNDKGRTHGIQKRTSGLGKEPIKLQV